MIIRIEGFDLPGRHCGDRREVAVGVQRRAEVVEVHRADTKTVSWTFEVTATSTADGEPDVRGPFVQGRPGGRFLYLSWGELTADGGFVMFRRAKLMFDAVGPDVLVGASRPGRVLVARLGLTDAHGMPLCAAVRPPAVTWSVA